MMDGTIPLSFSDSKFPIPQQMPSNQYIWPSYAETFSNCASGYSGSTRYAVPVQNDRAPKHNPLLLSNRVPGDNNFLSQCKVRALQSLQRHFNPCPPPPPPPSLGPFQNQMVRFNMAPENTQQRELCSIQAATKPEKPVVQPMHNILISYFNYKYNIKADVKSQQEFLNSLHLTVCRSGICKCESHRLLILHFEKCQDTSCSICGPVRLLCSSINQNQGFSGGVDCRGYVAQESQPVCKRTRIENTVQNDNWSLHAITGHHSNPQSSEGPIHIGESEISSSSKGFDDNKEMGNEIEAPHGEEINTDVEMQETGWVVATQVKGCDESLNSDMAKSDCQSGKKSEDLIQTTLNEEIPCSTGDIGEYLLSNGYDSEDMKIGSENALSNVEEDINKLLEELEVERADMGGDKSYGQSLNSDMSKSDCQSRGKSEDLIQTTLNEEIPCFIGDIGEHLLNNYDFDDMSIWSKNAFSYDEDINKFLEELEVERMGTSRDKSNGQSLKSDDECGIAKTDCQSGRDSEDLKVSGVSLIDFFTPEQIKEHLRSLNQHTHLTSGKGLAGDANICTVEENICQLCDVGGRKFSPPPMYCTCCEAQIKPGVTYYKPLEDGTSVKHSFCTSCFRGSHGGKGNISFSGLTFSKAKMEKCKHDEEVLEGWVQCDKCKGWQHQICALYNSKQDTGGDLEYVCPFCRLIEIEEKVHAPISSAFGARDLPRTKLSDHIEERLFRSLDKERKRRAESLGKSPEEVPGAEDIVVRVVLAVNKQLKVRQEFLDILPGETYPTEFPYKTKMLLLFQKFEGVDVCIFAMYLQEFGSECGHPNNRCVYISYLDSVKYFRPEIKTVDGVALRTFVYQQILIGYLDYCKQRGFAKCYIWACPPSKGEDYILYCHPETQKTPNPQKLLQWYKKMLRKAKEESVVVEYTNFYDSFFVPSRESNSKITTARLPYFDGDYWSSAIGNMIRIIDEEAKESKKKVKTKTTKRVLRAMGHSQGSDYNSKDMLVMQKLGQAMLPSKEEFFVVHLQFTCSNCHEPILSGTRLSCNQCSKFHLCHRCTEVGKTHTSIHGERHQLLEVRVNDVPSDTEDGDIVFDNDLFNDRIGFLMFCQENHYQFDSLRRAKHSSMMILHHLCRTQYIAQMLLRT